MRSETATQRVKKYWLCSRLRLCLGQQKLRPRKAVKVSMLRCYTNRYKVICAPSPPTDGSNHILYKTYIEFRTIHQLVMNVQDMLPFERLQVCASLPLERKIHRLIYSIRSTELAVAPTRY